MKSQFIEANPKGGKSNPMPFNPQGDKGRGGKSKESTGSSSNNAK